MIVPYVRRAREQHDCALFSQGEGLSLTMLLDEQEKSRIYKIIQDMSRIYKIYTICKIIQERSRI